MQSYKTKCRFNQADIENLSYKGGLKEGRQKDLHEKLNCSLQCL